MDLASAVFDRTKMTLAGKNRNNAYLGSGINQEPYGTRPTQDLGWTTLPDPVAAVAIIDGFLCLTHHLLQKADANNRISSECSEWRTGWRTLLAYEQHSSGELGN